jgi:tape measure domain-containing protein
MRFDNKQFESNVQTSMSTIDKLKQKLNLSGAAKGLDNLDKASKNVDMNGLSRGVESVTAKFSALQVMGMTALANITNSAVNLGKRMVSALTTTPITDGLKEYELQINSVQTIMANTGENVKTVNAALDELNNYADLTIYNFAEMTQNAGTFTAALGKGSLEKAMISIKGIGNWAAYAGANASDMSRATFQLGQALAQGSVRLQDWMSIEHTSGMAGQNFQNAFKETAKSVGIDVDSLIEKNGSFRESLKEGWLSTDVFMKTMEKFANDKSMTDAATKVKTFSQLIGTVGEALGTGWATTWRIIIGDFEEAKSLWTGVNDVISGFINKMSDARNSLLESALGKGFTSLSDKIMKIVEPVKKTSETIKKSVDTVSKLGNVVDKVILGKFGNGEDRFKALTKAGQNYYRVQNKVNETLGNSFRYTKEQIASQDKILGIKNKVTTKTKEESKETDNLTRAQKMQILNLTQLSEAQLKSKGYTDKQIASINELKETAKKLGIPIDEFILNIDKLNGRLLLINSFKNIGQSIVKVFKAIGDGWQEVIDPMSADDLFNIIAAFHKFTRSLIMTDETADKLKRTFKGVFALLDIITTITGGGLKLTLKGISAVLNIFGLSLLDVTAIAGDFIISIRDFLFSNNLITSSFKVLASGVKMVVSLFEKLIDTISELPQVQKFFKEIENIDLTEVGNNILEGLKNGLKDGVHTIPSILIEIGKGILDAIKGILGIHSPSTKMYEIGLNVIQGLVNGIKDGLGKIIDISKIIASKLYETVNDVDWNKVFVVASTIGLGLVVKRIGDILDKFASPFEGLGSVLESASGVIEASTKNVQRILKNTSKVIKSFSKVLNAKAWQMKASALKDMAISIAILAAAVYVLAQLDVAQLAKGVVVIGLLAVILVGLAVAMNKFASSEIALEKSNRGFSVKGLKTSLISIGIAILLIATTAKMLGGMNPDEMKQGFIGLAGVVAAIAVVFAAFGTFVKGKSAQNIDKAGKMIKKMATAMLLMAIVVKLVGMLSPEEMKKGVAFAVCFVAFVAALTKITSIGGKSVDKLGGIMIKMAFAMTLMVGVVKLAGHLSAEEMLKGAAFAAAFVLFVYGIKKAVSADRGTGMTKLSALLLSVSFAMTLMMGVVKLAGQLSASEMLKGVVFAGAFVLFVKALVNSVKMDSGSSIAKVSGLLLSMSVSMLLMVGVMKLVGMLSASEIIKGTAAVVAFGALMIAMIKAVKTAGPGAGKVAGTLTAMAVAIGIMAGVSALLSMVDIASLVKGLTAVGLLSVMLTAMIWATRGASDCMKNLIVMTTAIAIMAGAVALLSLLDTKKLAGATICLSTLMGMFAIMSKSTPLIVGSGKSLAIMVVVIAALAGICYILASLPAEATIGSAVALSTMLLSMAGALTIMSKIGPVSANALVAIGVLTAVMGAIGLILGLLNKYDLNASVTNATTLSGVLIALAAATKILSTVSSVSGSALAAISVLTLVMGGVGVILGLLNKYDLKADLETTKALSMVLIALSTSCAILAPIGAIAGPAATGAAQLMLAVGAAASVLVGVAGLVDLIPGAQQFLDGGIQVLEKLGYGLGAFFGNIVGGFTAGATSGLPEIAENLKSFVNTFSGIDSSSFDGVKTLADVITEISAASIFEGISRFLNFGQDPMKQFAENVEILVGTLVRVSNKLNESGGVDTTAIEKISNVGKIFSSLQSSIEPANGLLQAITGEKNLGDFGNQISAFVDNIKNAISAVSGISTDNLTNLESLANVGKVFTSLQSSIEPALGLKQAIMGSKDLGDLGTQITSYVNSIKMALYAVSGMPTEGLTNLESIANIGLAFTKLQSTVSPANGLLQALAGSKDIGTLGTQVATYAYSIRAAVTAVAGISAEGLTNLESIANIGLMFTKLQSTVEPANGLLQALAGSKSLGNFGFQVSTFASQLKTASSSLSGENAVDMSAIQNAVNAGQMLSALQKALPEEHWFDGKMNLQQFGTKISAFGTAMKSFGDSVAEVDTSKISLSITLGRRIAAFAKSIVDLDTSGISDFNKVKGIGSAIKSYNSKVSDIDTGTISKSITAANRLKNFVRELSGFDSSSISNFKVASLGKSIKSYSDSVSGFNAGTVSSSITAANRLKSFISSLAGLDTSGVSKFKSAISELGKTNVSQVASAFSKGTSKITSAGTKLTKALSSGIKSNSGAVTSAATSMVSSMQKSITGKASTFNASGSKLALQFIKGISSKKSGAVSAARALATSAASASKTGYGTMYANGAYLGAGLISGVNSKVSAAYSAGYALGRAAVRGEKDGQHSNSPSKDTIKAGKWLGEGLVIGTQSMTRKVSKAGRSMGEMATQSISSAISSAANLVDMGINSTPTIRPVVDLSDVKDQAATIGSLFSNPMVSPTSNIRAIKTLMDENSQNGNIDDVVSAINKLRKDMSNVGNTYNSINGVTYDDGSGISDAVETIFRAARIERRR